MKTQSDLSEAAHNYLAAIHNSIPVEWLDNPIIQLAEIQLEKALADDSGINNEKE